MVSSGSPYFTISDLVGSRLALQSPGIGRPAGGIHIREGGSSGGPGIQPQFSLDAQAKAHAVEGEGSEAPLTDYLWSLREAPGGGAPPSGPGGSFTRVSLPAFPTQLPYLNVTEQRTYQIRHAPTPEAMTFSGRANEDVSFSFCHLLLFSDYVMMIILFFSQVVFVKMGELHTLYS